MIVRHRPGAVGVRAAEGRARERGETLIELMIAVILMGTAIVLILGALMTATVVARQNADATKASNAVTNFTELAVAAVIDTDGSPEFDGGGATNYFNGVGDSIYFHVVGFKNSGASSNCRDADDDPTGVLVGLRAYDGYSACISHVEYVQQQWPNWAQQLVADVPPFEWINQRWSGFDDFGQLNGNSFWGASAATDITQPDGEDGDGGLQRITIEVSYRGEVVDTAVIVKRNTACPNRFDNADLGPC